MGNAKIWYYPDPNGTVEEIDLGEPLSDLQFEIAVDQAVSQGLRGAHSHSQYSSRAMVRVLFERFTSAATARDLMSLRTHLQAGGVISLAEDATCAVAGFVTQVPWMKRGTWSYFLQGQPWPYNTTATLSPGDEIEILGSQPAGLREFTTSVGSYAVAAPSSLTSTLRYDYSDSDWVLIRARGFWPLLRLPAEQRNQPIVTHDHRISYTMDVQLEEAIDLYPAFAGLQGGGISTTTVTGRRPTLPQVAEDPDQLGGGGPPGPRFVG